MVEVKTPTGAYCIDADTVTVGQYQKFLDDKKGDMSGQPDQCSINTTYAPQEKKGGDNPWPSAFCSLFAYINPATQPEVPMPCADWCDAHAYCAWAGKRLCGKLGGGPIDVFPIGGPEMIDDPPTTEWAFACSQGGKTQYSYGDTYDAAACKVAYEVTPPNYLAALAATNATCHGTQPPFDKIAGVGSLFEWLDGFGSDPMLSPIRASGNGSDPVGDRCSSVFEDVILSQNYVGVRCCTD